MEAITEEAEYNWEYSRCYFCSSVVTAGCLEAFMDTSSRCLGCAVACHISARARTHFASNCLLTVSASSFMCT